MLRIIKIDVSEIFIRIVAKKKIIYIYICVKNSEIKSDSKTVLSDIGEPVDLGFNPKVFGA